MTMREIELELQNKELQAERQLAQSKMRYADLFDFAPIGYASLDASGKIVEINLAAATLLGGTSHQFIGKPFTDFVKAEDEPKFLEHIQQCRTSGQRLRTELNLVPADGSPITVELYTVGGHEVEHGRLEYRCAMVNITERKRAEEALHRSQLELELRAKHHFLSEASAVFSGSLEYEKVLANIVRLGIPKLADCCVLDIVQADGSLARSAVAHLDPEKESLLWELGKLPSDRNDAFGKTKVIRTARSELYAEVTDSLLKALARGPDHTRILQKLGIRSFMCVPLIVRGKPIGALGFMRVQSEQRYALFDLALAEEFADRAAMAIDNAMLYSKEQEANRLKDEFLAIVSHELRTPLTPILGAMYRLKLIRPDDTEVQAMAGIVERNAKAQSRLVEDLLDVSRVATGKFELSRHFVDLQPALELAAEVARPAADAKGIHIELSIPEGLKEIWCDPDRIQQALWNLLSNAIKFSAKDGRIRMSAESTPQNLRIRVTDQGAGISEDFLPHVFEPFRQADQFTTRHHGGLGLGLAIVEHIVHQHGGTIRAESGGEGKGSTFTVELPYSPKRANG